VSIIYEGKSEGERAKWEWGCALAGPDGISDYLHITVDGKSLTIGSVCPWDENDPKNKTEKTQFRMGRAPTNILEFTQAMKDFIHQFESLYWIGEVGEKKFAELEEWRRKRDEGNKNVEQ
jgi:hypothetical protein